MPVTILQYMDAFAFENVVKNILYIQKIRAKISS